MDQTKAMMVRSLFGDPIHQRLILADLRYNLRYYEDCDEDELRDAEEAVNRILDADIPGVRGGIPAPVPGQQLLFSHLQPGKTHGAGNHQVPARLFRDLKIPGRQIDSQIVIGDMSR